MLNIFSFIKSVNSEYERTQFSSSWYLSRAVSYENDTELLYGTRSIRTSVVFSYPSRWLGNVTRFHLEIIPFLDKWLVSKIRTLFAEILTPYCRRSRSCLYWARYREMREKFLDQKIGRSKRLDMKSMYSVSSNSSSNHDWARWRITMMSVLERCMDFKEFCIDVRDGMVRDWRENDWNVVGDLNEIDDIDEASRVRDDVCILDTMTWIRILLDYVHEKRHVSHFLGSQELSSDQSVWKLRIRHMCVQMTWCIPFNYHYELLSSLRNHSVTDRSYQKVLSYRRNTIIHYVFLDNLCIRDTKRISEEKTVMRDKDPCESKGMTLREMDRRSDTISTRGGGEISILSISSLIALLLHAIRIYQYRGNRSESVRRHSLDFIHFWLIIEFALILWIDFFSHSDIVITTLWENFNERRAYCVSTRNGDVDDFVH